MPQTDRAAPRDPLDVYREIARRADEVIIAKEVTVVNFYEEWVRDGKRIVYFGTKESYEKWKCDAAD